VCKTQLAVLARIVLCSRSGRSWAVTIIEMKHVAGNGVSIQALAWDTIARSWSAAMGLVLFWRLALLHPLSKAKVAVPRCQNPGFCGRVTECADQERHLGRRLDIRRLEDVQVVARPQHGII